jgi:rare lipoprotein A
MLFVSSRLVLAAVSVVTAGLVFAPPAHAREGAPITYAATPSSNDLAGGAPGSYGYGRAQAPAGPLIDLRPNAPEARSRQTAADAPSSAQAAPRETVQGAGQGAPDWLEHERVGQPYQANGRWYVPTAEPGYSQTGTASWYGPGFHGQASASGEPYDQNAMTAAMPTLPIPSLVQVTNLANGREVILRVTDRGPFVGDRIIDVSHRAAEVLGFDQTGTARVHVRYLGPAPKHYVENGQGSAPLQMAAAPLNAGALDARAPAQAPVTYAVTYAGTYAAASYGASSAASPAPVRQQDGPVSLLPPSSESAESASDEANAPSLAQTRPAQNNVAQANVVQTNVVQTNGAQTAHAAQVETVSWVQSAPHALSPAAVPGTSSLGQGAGGYVVQVGAFSDPATAERVAAHVQSVGAAHIDARAAGSGELHRVRLGPYATREEAEAARQGVANLGYAEAIVAR